MSHLGRSTLAATCALALLAGCKDGPTGPRVSTLAIGVEGLPQKSTAASVRVTGPDGFLKQLSASTVLVDLVPGAYSIATQGVTVDGTEFLGDPPTQTFSLGEGVRDSATAAYRVATGTVDLYIGIVPGVTPSVHVTGPNGYTRVLLGNTRLKGLVPGTYTFAPDTISAKGYTFAGNAATVEVPASLTAIGVSLAILPITGAVRVDVSGLPSTSGTLARLTGPDGFSRDITGSATLTDVPPGRYTLVSESPVVDAVTWRAPGVDFDVLAGVTARRSLEFVPVAPDGSVLRNLRVRGFTLTQVVQRSDNSVPMIAGRGALLRVFLLSSVPNTDRPTVRARFFRAGVPVDSITIVAPASSVPTSLTETATTGTWDVPIPGSLLQPGLAIQVEADPDRQIADATHSDNLYPATAPLDLQVVTGARPSVVLVPVQQSKTGLTGNASDDNKDAIVDLVRRIYPIAGVDVSVHATYTTDAPALEPNDGSRAWSTILSEINARRIAEGSNSYYFGVVRVSYNAGIAGLGFVGGRAAIGWDYEKSIPGVIAHELGHNFGRYHAPCGGAAGVDPAYPYFGAGIGVVGWDSTRSILWPADTPDLMSYCHPEWISDYTYMGVFDALVASALPATTSAVEEPCLLLWGRVENGVPVLEPAFEVRTRPSLPARDGPVTFRALASNGDELLSFSFTPEAVADLPGEASFAFAVPLSMLRGRALAELRLRARGGEARSLPARGVAPPSDPRPGLTRRDARQASLRWNAAAYPMVLVRDARTGEVLSFARGGDASFRTDRREVVLVFSDRVGSVTRRVAVP